MSKERTGPPINAGGGCKDCHYLEQGPHGSDAIFWRCGYFGGVECRNVRAPIMSGKTEECLYFLRKKGMAEWEKKALALPPVIVLWSGIGLGLWFLLTRLLEWLGL